MIFICNLKWGCKKTCFLQPPFYLLKGKHEELQNVVAEYSQEDYRFALLNITGEQGEWVESLSKKSFVGGEIHGIANAAEQADTTA